MILSSLFCFVKCLWFEYLQTTIYCGGMVFALLFFCPEKVPFAVFLLVLRFCNSAEYPIFLRVFVVAPVGPKGTAALAFDLRPERGGATEGGGRYAPAPWGPEGSPPRGGADGPQGGETTRQGRRDCLKGEKNEREPRKAAGRGGDEKAAEGAPKLKRDRPSGGGPLF